MPLAFSVLTKTDSYTHYKVFDSRDPQIMQLIKSKPFNYYGLDTFETEEELLDFIEPMGSADPFEKAKEQENYEKLLKQIKKVKASYSE
jgi:hypothetical protein